jgi:hypothetical protein
MELSRAVFRPIPKILLVDASQQMKVSFVTGEHYIIRWNILQDSLTGVTAVDPVALIQFLTNHHFVRMELKVCV